MFSFKPDNSLSLENVTKINNNEFSANFQAKNFYFFSFSSKKTGTGVYRGFLFCILNNNRSD